MGVVFEHQTTRNTKSPSPLPSPRVLGEGEGQYPRLCATLPLCCTQFEFPRSPITLSHVPPLITLTTDFGTSDAYVATMKAAILRHCPEARLIDVTHHVPPQDILCGSITLERAVDGFPPGTIHLAVVDPGVGTKRKLLIVELKSQLVICPDNGLITWPWRRLGPGRAHELQQNKLTPRLAATRQRSASAAPISHTFHGRDILGPAAGMLASGIPLTDLSRPITDPILLKITPTRWPAAKGQIIHIDSFGNATTNIPHETILKKKNLAIHLAKVKIGPLKKTYQTVPPGKPLALIGSSGLLEIAIRDGSAVKTLNAQVGDPITLE
jgi:S-adenosylmethionine hydrolase